MKSARGFTLLELLIAVSLAAGVAALGMMLMRTTLSADERWAARKGERAAVRDVLLQIEHFWREHTDLEFNAERGRVNLLLRAGTGTLKHVGFACEPTADGEGFSLALYRVSLPPAPTVAGAGIDPPPLVEARELLLDNLRACAFGFLAPPPRDNAETPARWVTEWQGRTPPALLRLDLATAHGTLPPFIPTREVR